MHSTSTERGKLFVVATPIGNLQDLSPRAVQVLSEVECVLAEDTRKFGLLKTRTGISTRCLSMHEHNEAGRIPQVVELMENGKNLALISDAGTPTISDPGFRLVSTLRKSGFSVIGIPGPCAAITALSISGFETNRFTFEGFLPTKSGKRSSTLESALSRKGPTIFYESPHRIIKTLEALFQLQPSAEICCCRELTKLHEESLLGSCQAVLEELQNRPGNLKGEFVLILRGSSRLDKQSRSDQ